MLDLIMGLLASFDAAAIGDVLEAGRGALGSGVGGGLEAGYNSR